MSRARVPGCVVAALLALGMAGAVAQATLISTSTASPGKIVARTGVDAATAPTAADFALRLDGATTVPATGLASVPASANSAALLLCVDRSGSMGAAALAAIQDVLRNTLVPRAGETQLPLSVALVAFGTRSTHLLALTSDPPAIVEAVSHLALDREREGKTRLNDAIAGAVAELRDSPAAWKRILVVSDGNDEGSALTQAALIQLATAPPSIAIDAIGFGTLASSSSGSLATLAGATNGRFAIAGTRADLAAALGRMIREVVPPPQFDVAFAYAAARDGSKAEAPVLEFRPRQGAVVRIPLGVQVAAAATSVAAPARTGTAGTDTTGGAGSWKTLFDAAAIKRVIAGAPLAVWIGLGLGLLVVALVAFFALRRGKRPLPAPLPLAPWPSPSPPPVPGPTYIEPEPPVAQSGARRTVVAFRWPAPAEGSTVAILHGLSGALAGRQFNVTTASTRIGAASGNDLILDGDSYVSGHHAILKAEANGLYMVDLESRNGCELNGTKFTGSTRSLLPGDRVAVGRTTFEVRTADLVAAGGQPKYEPRAQ